MKTILVVEDEVNLNKIIADYLIKEGYRVFSAHDGAEALDQLEQQHIDLMILDIMLPKVDGWSVLKRTRKHLGIPVILLTARDDEDDKLMGYELGTDEYVTKPFSNKVLMARVKRLLERVPSSALPLGALQHEGITIDLDAHTVTVAGQALTLTPKLYSLLVMLIENKGQVLTRERILNQVWGYDFYGDSRVVDSHVKKLRKVLGDEGRAIKTIVKFGYKLE